MSFNGSKKDFLQFDDLSKRMLLQEHAKNLSRIIVVVVENNCLQLKF